MRFSIYFLTLFILTISLPAEARLPDLIPYRKGNLWGYSDSTKKMIIEPKYDYVSFFENGLAVVSEKSKYGIIDQTGKIVLELKYNLLVQTKSSQYYVFDNGMLMQGLINLKGDTVIPPVYEWIIPLDSNYYRCMYQKEMSLIDKRGKLLGQFFDSDWEFGASYIAEAAAFIVYNKRKFGVIDTNGTLRIPLAYKSLSWLDCGEFEAFKRSKVQYYSKEFKLLPEDHEKCNVEYPFIHFTPIAKKGADGKYQYGWKDNSTGKIIIEPLYEYTGYFNHGFAKIKQDGKYGFVDVNLSIKIDPKYPNVSNFEENGFAYVYENLSIGKNVYYVSRTIGYLDIHGTEYWED